MANNIKVGLELGADGGDAAAASISGIANEVQGLNKPFEHLKGAIASTEDQIKLMINAFELDKIEGIDQVAKDLAALRLESGATAEQFEELQRASGLTVDQFKELDAGLALIEKRNTDDLIRLANTLGSNLTGAQQFAESLGLTADQANQAAARIKQLESAGASQEETFAVLNREMNLTVDQMEAIQSASSGAADQLGELDGELAAIEKRNTDDLAKLASTLGTNLAGAKAFADALGLTADEGNQASARMKELSQAGASQEEVFDAVGREMNLTAEQMEKLKNSSKEAATGSQALNVALGNLASEAASAAIAKLTETIQGSIGVFAEYEAGITGFRAISGESGASIKALEDQVKSLGANTAASATDISGATVDLARIGISAKQSADLLPALVKGSIATGEELGSLSNAIGGVAQQFGELDNGTARLEAVGSVLVSVANNSNTNVVELSQGLKNSAGAARALGLSVEDSAFALGVFAQAGLQGAEAGTTFRSMLSKLGQAAAVMSGDFDGKVSPAVKNTVALLDQYGIQITDTNGKMLETPDLFRSLSASLMALGSDTERLTVASRLFGEEYASKIVAALQLGEEEFARQAEAAYAAGDALNETAEIMGQGLAGAFDLFSSAVEGVQIAVGEELAPALELAVRSGAALISAFTNAPPVLQKMVIGTGALVATLAAAVAITSAYNAVLGTGAIASAVASAQATTLSIARGASSAATALTTLATQKLSIAQIAEAATSKAGAIAMKVKAIATATAGKAAAASTLQFAAAAGAIGGVVAVAVILADTWQAVDGEAAAVRESTQSLTDAMNEAKVATGEAAEVDFEGQLNGFQRGLDAIRGAIPGLTTAAEASADRQAVAFSELVGQSEKNLKISQELAASKVEDVEAGKKQVAAIEANIAALSEQVPVTDDQVAAQKSLIDSLEASKQKILEKLPADAQANELAAEGTEQVGELGSAYEQLAAKAKAAQEVLAAGTGTTEELDTAATDLMAAQEQQLELGKISREESIKSLDAIAKNTKLSAETQLAAEQKLTEAKENELQSRLQQFKNAQDEIQRDVEAGRVDELEGEKALTASKLEGIETEVAARQEALSRLEQLGRGGGEEAEKIRQQLVELAGDAEEIALESAKKQSEIRLKELEEEQTKAKQIRERAQIEASNELKELQLQGLAGESEVQAQRLSQEKESLEQQSKLRREAAKAEQSERRKLLDENLKFADNPEEEEQLRRKFREETEAFKRGEAIETAKLEGQLLDNALAQEEARREALREQIATDAMVAKGAIDQQVAANGAIEASLNRQSALIQAQSDLYAAQNALQQQIIENQIAGYDRALGAIADIEAAQKTQADSAKAVADGIKAQADSAANVTRKLIEQNQVTSAREQLLQSQIDAEEEGSQKRISLERELGAVQRARATERLKLEQELAAQTGNQSGVIQAQLALAKDGTREKAALERQLAQELEREERARFQTEIEAEKAKQAEIQKGIEEAKRAAEIAAAEEAQRQEELAQLGLGPDATELDVIRAKQSAEDELAAQKLEALLAEQRQQELSLELDIERNRLAGERNLLQARAAALAAQQAQAEAKIALQRDPNNKLLQAQVELAGQGLELALEGIAGAEADLKAQEQSANVQRELLALQQEAALKSAAQAEQTRQLDQGRELAAQGVKGSLAEAQKDGLRPEDFRREEVDLSALQNIGSSLTEAFSLLELPPLEPLPPVEPSEEWNRGWEENVEAIKEMRASLDSFATAATNQKPPVTNLTVQVGTGADMVETVIKDAGI